MQAQRIANERGITMEHFTFHDIKARAATIRDTRGGDVGHKSEAMREVYIRGVKEVEATE